MSLASSPTAAADDTRSLLLASAAREIHSNGFRSASLSRILAETGVTKGALYHHFANKRALGYAVLEECYAPVVRATWIDPLQRETVDAVSVLIDTIRGVGAAMSPQDLARGCPINNLAQEMSPVDAGFRARIAALLDEWCSAIELALQRAQMAGQLRAGVQPSAVATFVVASLEGCIGMAKNAQSHDLLMQCDTALIDYLNSLRIAPDKEAG